MQTDLPLCLLKFGENGLFSPVSSVSKSESRPVERTQRKLKALNLLDAYQEHPSKDLTAQQLQPKKHGHHKHRRKSKGSSHYRAPLLEMEMVHPFQLFASNTSAPIIEDHFTSHSDQKFV